MKPSLLIPASLLLFPLLTMAAAPKSKSSPDLAAQAGNEFAFELFAKIAGDPANQDKNLFISPHSISTALSMALEGARGKTQEEMALALGLGDPKEQAKFMASLKALAASLQPDSGAKVEATRKELASLREKLESLQQKHAKLESENKYDALFPNQ